MGWLSNYKYRKSITLSRASGAVTNYQMKLLVEESSGSELLSNGAFTSNTTGWTAYQCALASVAGGQSGNCLEMTRTSGTAQQAYQAVTSLVTVGKRYRLSGYVKNGTAGAVPYRLAVHEFEWVWSSQVTGTSSGDWVYVSLDFTMQSATIIRFSVLKDNDTAGTILFDECSLKEIGDVDCGGLCLSTFNDIRFTTSDGTTLLDYWIESISGATPNQLATIWIEFNSIGTGATTFYLYYGNAGAAAYSSGANTFIKFDDFERGSDGDTIGGDWTEGAAHVHISTERNYGGTRSVKLIGAVTIPYATIPLSAGTNYAIELMLYKEDAASVVPITHGDGTKRATIRVDTDEGLYNFPDGTWVDTGTVCSADVWKKIAINNLDFTAGTFDVWYNNALVNSGLSMYTNASFGNIVRIYGDGVVDRDSWVDNFIVRNWRSTEPAWGAWGAEES